MAGRRFDGPRAAVVDALAARVFAIAQGDPLTPSVLRAIAGVFAGGSPEYLVARAVVNAAVREVRTLTGR